MPGHYKDVAVEPLLAGTKYQEQIEWERASIEDGIRKYHELREMAIKRGDGGQLKSSQLLILHWLDPLTHLIECMRSDGALDHCDVLRLMRADQAAVITINELLGMMLQSGGYQIKVVSITHAIGRAIFAEIEARILRRHQKDIWTDMQRQMNRLRPKRIRHRAAKVLSVWNRTVTTHRVGAALLHAVLESASDGDYMTEVFSPAFKRVLVTSTTAMGIRKTGMIRISRRALRVLDDPEVHRHYARPRYTPMLVQPMPWSPDHEGGYIHIRTPFVSRPRHSQKKALAAADMPMVYEAANTLASTAWRINPRTFEVMRQVMEQNGNVAGVPRLAPLPMPLMPADYEDLPKDQKKAVRRERGLIIHENHLIKAEARTWFNKWYMGEKLQPRDRFYFPHIFCFRGRAYPLPAAFHHHQDDTTRGLLEFADAVPVDNDDARKWLMLHAANMYGFDKASYDERVAWVRANMESIDSFTDDPLRCDTWMQAKKPWQFLAACFALVDEDRAVHIPTQVDGTCNGLQHYAAMGRDPIGAKQANLIDCERPNDVYQPVAEAVAAMVADDASTNEYAMAANGLVDRELVKQVVMTTTYGVTAIGARNQMLDRLKKMNFDTERQFKAARYLSNCTMQAIARTNPAAAGIMSWLRTVARACTSPPYVLTPMRWTTPIGWPVVQPYRSERTRSVSTVLQSLQLTVPDECTKVNQTKHATGMAPNYVHSIDATHMMMTASACGRRDMAFAAVHDAYWTHAGSMERLHKIIPEKFTELHTPHLLTDLHDQLRERCPSVEIDPPPPPGDFDIQTCMRASYLFS